MVFESSTSPNRLQPFERQDFILIIIKSYFVFFLLWPQLLLISNELLFHEQIIFDALLTKQFQATSRMRQNLWQFIGRFGSLRAFLLFAYASGHWRLVLFLFVLFKFTDKQRVLSKNISLELAMFEYRELTLSSFLSPGSRPAPGCLFPFENIKIKFGRSSLFFFLVKKRVTILVCFYFNLKKINQVCLIKMNK